MVLVWWWNCQACGLIMSGVQDEASLAAARRICLIMGEYFQIQVLPAGRQAGHREEGREGGARGADA